MERAGAAPLFDTVLLLGGGGLVGTQVAKRAASDLAPRRIVIATLFRQEAIEAIEAISAAYPSIVFEGYYGNIFLRGEPMPIERDVPMRSPMEQKKTRQCGATSSPTSSAISRPRSQNRCWCG